MMIKIITVFLCLFLTSFNVNAKVLDLFGSEEKEETSDYSSSSDQPLKRNFNLRQVQKAFNNSKLTDNIANFTYNPKQIYKVKTRLHTDTMIYLPKGEKIMFYSLGDDYVFEVNVFPDEIPNLIRVKSLYSGADTSLSVISKSGKNYSFYIRSYGVKDKSLPDLAVFIKFKERNSFQFVGYKSKVQEHQVKTVKLSKKDKEYNKRLKILKDLQKDNDYLKSIKDPNKININYKIYGDKEIAPFGVYDDGKWTYFDFREDFVSNRLPVVYKVIDDYDSVVNTRIENGFLIAESISPSGWTLKNGDKSVCIKPKDNLLKKYAPKPIKKINDPQSPKKAKKQNLWQKLTSIFKKKEEDEG